MSTLNVHFCPLTLSITATVETSVIATSVVVHLTDLAVDSSCVVTATSTATSVTGSAVKFRVKLTGVRETITVTGCIGEINKIGLLTNVFGSEIKKNISMMNIELTKLLVM